MAGEDTSGRWRSHWPKRLRYGQTAAPKPGRRNGDAGGRQPARQQGAVVSSPAPRSTLEARASSHGLIHSAGAHFIKRTGALRSAAEDVRIMT